MRQLNYHHLMYFWTVAREGSIAKASEVLHLTPQTISGQLKLLESAIGEALFHRSGRSLTLTETGQTVRQYADEIFSLGAELTQRIRSKEPGIPESLNVGVVNSIAKLITYRMVEPAMSMDNPVRVVCTEGPLNTLLAELAVHRLDLVISDRSVPTGLNVKAYSHPLGTSEVAFFGRPDLVDRYRPDFPHSLHGAPMLLPAPSTTLRRKLDEWFDRHDVVPVIKAECDDSALLKAFGDAGKGLFPAPAAIADEIEQMYHCARVGKIEQLTESYFAISPERKLKHPAVTSITRMARD
ncbi:MAG: transcriptional activator NhaR, partial [Lysobacterales bacterium]